MKNLDSFFKKRHTAWIKSLEKRWKNEVEKKPGAFSDKRSKFNKIIGFERDNIIEETVHKDPFSYSGQFPLKNNFKKDLVERFYGVYHDFPKEGINGFAKLLVPELREKHINIYESGQTENYQAEPRFMYDASLEDIFEMISKFYAYQDFIEIRPSVVYLDSISTITKDELPINIKGKKPLANNWQKAAVIIAFLGLCITIFVNFILK